jgi:hypothetical protein
LAVLKEPEDAHGQPGHGRAVQLHDAAIDPAGVARTRG